MPLIRTESSQKSANQEGKISLVFDNIQNGYIKSIRPATQLYNIQRSTLQLCIQGVVSIADRHPSSLKLTQYEEDLLTKWIIPMDSRGAEPRPFLVRKMANILLAVRGRTPLPTISVNWSSAFFKAAVSFSRASQDSTTTSVH